MRQITNLLEKMLLAEVGLDENQIADIGKRRLGALPDWVQARVPAAKVQELTALRELAGMSFSTDRALLAETMTVAHFTTYFANTLSRMFYKDYEYQQGEWQQYIFVDANVPDFRLVQRFRMSEPENLTLRREKQNHRETYIQAALKDYGVEEWSRAFDVSWRTILNDDLGKIAETPQRMAGAARRSLDSFVSGLYDNATSQAALVALGATYAGTGRLTLANLAVGVNAMKQHQDALGNPIAINKVHLVVPPVLQIQAAQIMKDLISYGGPNSNVIADFIAGVHVDPYISFSGANVPWYLFADPSEIPTVTLARLSGWPGPVVMRKSSDISVISGSAPAAFLEGDFSTGDIVFAVEDVYGGDDDDTLGGITNPFGIYYSSGTTA